jgi:hypothetical protein
LDTRGICYPQDSTKVELFQLIKINKYTFQKFSADRLLARHGHAALRLPPYHPELNLTQKMWATLKNWVAMKNVKFQLQDVQKLAEEKFSSITKEDLLPVSKHIQEVEEKYVQN